MGRRSAHIEVADGRLIAGPARRRPQKEQLLERELALKDVALGEAKFTLEIERRDHLPMQDDVLDVRRVLRERVDDRVTECLTLLVPRSFLQVIRCVLNE